MWYDNVDKNVFLKQLYNEVPSLENIVISNIDIQYNRERVVLRFDMPNYVDNPPKKWSDANYNAVSIQVDFGVIRELEASILKKTSCVNIEISRDMDGYICLSICGDIELKLISEVCYIQTIDGYIKSNICNGFFEG